MKLFALLLLFASIPALAQNTDCGTERWPVKTLEDKDTAFINYTPLETSVCTQAHFPTISPHTNDVRRPDERQVYRLTGYVLQFKLERDGDIHLVLKDADSAISMIAEIPNPDCPSVALTGHAEAYRTARKWVSEHLGGPVNSFKQVIPLQLVTITGVGFYDPFHGQTGAAPSNREIHPVLTIESANGPHEWEGIEGKLDLEPSADQSILHVSIQLSAPEWIQEVQVLNDTGALLWHYYLTGSRVYVSDIPIGSLSTGAYYVRVMSGTGEMAKKFIVKR